MKTLILLIISLMSCMNKKKYIDLEKDFLNTKIEKLILTYKKDSVKIFKIDDLNKYRFYGVKPNSIRVFKESDIVTKLILEIKREEYVNFIEKLYFNNSKPNVFISFNDNVIIETETMLWKQGSSKQNIFSRNKISQYDFLVWNVRGYDLLIKNKQLISVEIIERRKSL